MTGFVYKWTNKVNGKWYIGSHKGTVDDGYRHSSIVMEQAERKYGLESFEREILYQGDRYREVEGEYLQTYDAVNNTKSYNRRNTTGPAAISEETRKKFSQVKSGERNPMWGKKGKDSPLYGIKRSTETRKKLSDINSGKGNPNWGRDRGDTPRKRARAAGEKVYRGTKACLNGHKEPLRTVISNNCVLCLKDRKRRNG